MHEDGDRGACVELVGGKVEVRERVAEARDQGRAVGLVPTMGYLHEGHLSLVEAARERDRFVVMSIFVNPTQFGPGEDLDTYPRDLERDTELATEAGVDLVFHPDAGEMYPHDHSTWVDVEGLTGHLCGASRPGHFRGVGTVVAKLLNIVQPDRAYFGQKDGQQALVISRMIRDLDFPVEPVVCPIVREGDGLAVSSRNVYLSAQERTQAPVLYAGLQEAADLCAAGERDGRRLVMAATQKIREAPHAEIDYVELVRTSDVQPTDVVDQESMLAVAVRFGATRLIDNVILDPAQANRSKKASGEKASSSSSPTC